MNWELLYYAFGYLFSIVAGHVFVLQFSKKAWTALGEIPKNEVDMPYRWTSSMAGMVDRIIFTSSLLFHAKEFIAIWLAFKIAVQWKRWDDKKDLGKARASFHIFLIGTGLSLMYGVVGGLLVKWLNHADYMPAIVFPLILIAFNLFVICVAKRNTTVKSKK